jgi:hypothetical protein
VTWAAPRYACFLPDAPGVDAADLVLCAGVEYQLGPSIPAGLLPKTPHRGRFLPGYPILWAAEPGTGAVHPMWIPRRFAREVGALCAGEPAGGLPPTLAGGLAAAGVLGTLSAHDARRRARESTVEAARSGYTAGGCGVAPALVDGGPLEALREYHRRLLTGGGPALGDGQCARRHGIHNEPMARFFQYQLWPAVQAIAGAALLPSYTYTVRYEPGAVLDAHTDREQCEITVSLLVDAEPAGAEPWPLWIGTAGGPSNVRQRPGDGVVFAGRRLPHWRDELPAGQTSTSLLLHYVPAGFTGSLR